MLIYTSLTFVEYWKARDFKLGDRKLEIAGYYVVSFPQIIETFLARWFIGAVRNFRRPPANFD